MRQIVLHFLDVCNEYFLMVCSLYAILIYHIVHPPSLRKIEAIRTLRHSRGVGVDLRQIVIRDGWVVLECDVTFFKQLDF